MDGQQYGASAEIVLVYHTIIGGKSGGDTAAAHCHVREKVMKSIVKMVQ